MRKRNVLTALAAAAMVLQLVGGIGVGRAAAQTTPDVVFSFTPTSGLPGTKITVTGTGCPHDATKAFDGIVFLTQGSINTPPVPVPSRVSRTRAGTSGKYVEPAMTGSVTV